MSIHVKIHKTKVNDSYPIKYNNQQYFIETNFPSLINQIDEEEIILDHTHTFFLKEIESNKIFRIYLADFRARFQTYSFPLIEDYKEIPSVKISGTIVFI